jgi:hypothetical protein
LISPTALAGKIEAMSDEDDRPKGFEETLRAIADEVSRGLQNFKTDDLEDMARSYGVDAERAKRFFDTAGDWLRAQADNLGATPFPGTSPDTVPKQWEDSWRGAGPDPLDMPNDDQGRALAALDSGRWRVEPGTSMLTSTGDGPGPRDGLGLALELRVRDWLDAEGELTLAGRAALKRWLDG